MQYILELIMYNTQYKSVYYFVDISDLPLPSVNFWWTYCTAQVLRYGFSWNLKEQDCLLAYK